MDIKNVYNQLTNVDIEQQKRIWDERGLAGFKEKEWVEKMVKQEESNGD